MLTINLLPENLRAKKKSFDFPVFPILCCGFLILTLFFIGFRINIFSNKKVINDMRLDLHSVQIKSVEAGKLKEGIMQKNAFLQSVVFKKLFPTYSLTLIFNQINKTLPRGMWFKEIRYYTEEGKEHLSLKGFMKPVGYETMIASIGRFNQALKEFFEKSKNQYPAYLMRFLVPVEVSPDASEIDFSMTTKRRKAEKIEITQFSTVFTL